jgi:hypothetical protein
MTRIKRGYTRIKDRMKIKAPVILSFNLFCLYPRSSAFYPRHPRPITHYGSPHSFPS